MLAKAAAFEHVAKLLLAPAPPRLGRVAQRVDQLRRLARHPLGAFAHRRDLAVEHAEGVAALGLDLRDRLLIFFEPLVNGREQRLQILSRAFLALLEARLGAFEKRLLRPETGRASGRASRCQ